MNQNIKDLLEQLDRLAEYVGHQGEAAHDGVQASADHLVYLAKSISLAVEQLDTAIEDQAVEREQHQNAVASLPAGRNAQLVNDTVRDIAKVAALVSQARFEPIYTFDTRRVSLGTIDSDGTAMGLIEWYYLLPGSKSVERYLYEDGTAILSVRGMHQGHNVSTQLRFHDETAISMIKDCVEPSIHLLRRLQIAGAR